MPDVKDDLNTVGNTLLQGTRQGSDMENSQNHIEKKDPGREKFRQSFESKVQEYKKDTLMTKEMWTALQDAYTAFGSKEEGSNDTLWMSILTPYLQTADENSEFFSFNLTTFLQGIKNCKEVFSEMSLSDVATYNEKYSEYIQEGEDDGFDFASLATAKKEFGDGLTWQQVQLLTDNAQSSFSFRDYTQTHQLWGSGCTTEVFLGLEDKDPGKWNYVKELWGNLITTDHRKKYPTLDPSKLISIKHAIHESMQGEVVISDDMREKIADSRYYSEELVDLVVPYDAEGLPKKMKWEKDEIVKWQQPGAQLFLTDKYNADDIDHIFGYLEKKGLLGNFQSITLYETGLETIPEQLQQCTHLKRLSVSGNKLTTLPNWLDQCRELTSLDMRKNNFSVVPEVVVHCSGLELLSFAENKLTELPTTLGQLTRLKYLSIGQNQLTTLPESIGQLENLYEFTAGNNQLTSLPHLTGCRSLENVRLENNAFTTFPSTLLEVTTMRALILKNNAITSLPQQIEQLPRLEYLNMENNKLTELPQELVQLPITDLTISGNNIADLSMIQHMYALDSLEMNNNKVLTTLPALPPSLHEVSIDRTVQIPPQAGYTLHEKRATDDPVRTLTKVTTLSDLSTHLKTDKLTPDHYEGIAKYNPLLFIQLLEESRKYETASPAERQDEYFYFSEGGLPKRQDILTQLDAPTLLVLISRGSQELLRSYESTFFHIFHTWLKKDPQMTSLSSLGGIDQRKLLSTVIQLTPRYLHLGGSKPENIQNLLTNSIQNSLPVLIQHYNETTAMQNILPIILLARGEDKKMKVLLQPFLDQLTTGLQQFRKEKTNENYNLTGLLFAQLEECGIKTGLTGEEKTAYALPDLKTMQSLDVKQRNESDPCVTRLFFDNDSDGKESFTHWLRTIGLTGGKTELKKGSVTYKLEEKEHFVYISVSTPKGVVSHIIANRPEAGDSAGTDIETFLKEKTGGENPETKITYDFVVDRGHAGHEQAGLSAISQDTEIALIGSCGGFAHMAKALQKNSALQYIGTTGTGVMSVNDAYFRSIIDGVATQQAPHRPSWSPKQEYIKEYKPGQYQQNVGSYHLPDSNILVPFKNALDKLNSSS